MNRFFLALVAMLVLVSSNVHSAVTCDGYATGPGGYSIPYELNGSCAFAGPIEFQSNGTPLYVFSSDYANRVNVGDSWPMTFYSYEEVQNGAPVKWSKEQYSKMWSAINAVFPEDYFTQDHYTLTQLFGLSGNDMLAQTNKQVWHYTDPNVPAGECGGNCSTFNWSGMGYVASGVDEYLFMTRGQNITVVGGTNITMASSVPVPPAIWLLGSGLLGLIGVARRSK